MTTDGKIFCIGFNKTGTTSLHHLFKAGGLKSLHSDSWPIWSHSAKLKAEFENARCYTDGQDANFKNLDNWFPGSLFILNVRGLKPWLYSRIKHVMRLGFAANPSEGIYKQHLGPMARQFFTSPSLAIDKWILDREMFHAQARNYFQARSKKFMEIDVTTSENWQETLSGFISSNGIKFKLKPGVGEIRSNTRDAQESKDKDLLTEYFALADARIALLSKDYPLA